MEQNNIENQIREKLNSREIKPTEMSWDRLDAMLTVAEEKISKKGFSWLFIAACFLGMLTLVTIIYQLNSNEIKVENEVVNQEKNTKINNNSNNKIQNSNIIQEQVKVPTENFNTTIQSKNNSQLATNNSKLEIRKLQQNFIINQKTTEKLEKEISIPLNETIVQVENPKVENKEFATSTKQVDVSSEKLLAEVDNARKSVKQSKVVVNASSLLSQVNGEINKDYRETNFQKLKRNFETVKVAVTNRNNQ